MIRLTALDDKTTVMSIPPQRIARMEVIVEKRGGHIHYTDGQATSVGTRLFVDGIPEPVEVLEHLFQVEDLIDPDSEDARKRREADIAARMKARRDLIDVLTVDVHSARPVKPGDKLP